MDMVPDGLRSATESELRVARAIGESLGQTHFATKRYLPEARAAIRAMKRPEATVGSWSAKANLDDWTTPNGGLVYEHGDERVTYNSGAGDLYICGTFDAETLMEIAMHMRSQQI